MTTEELLGRLGLALAIGLLVGLERGWRERDAPDRSRTAGIRTFGLSGLLGGITALLAQAWQSSLVFAVVLVSFAFILTLYKLREAVADEDYSVTTIIAGLLVFALGALAIVGDYVLAAAGGTALAAVLASREILHGFLRRLSWAELRAALILAVMTAIVLPLLPDRTIDPWGGVNPRQIWMFTILVATLSYAGYVASRILGTARGLLVSTLLGATVSSTAMTVALARRSRDAPTATVGAAALAAAVSILRVWLIVAVLGQPVWLQITPAILFAAAVFIGCGLWLLYCDRSLPADGTKLHNPFETGPILLFAASFAAIAALSAYLTSRLGAVGMMATSALSGMFDVDVAVLSALRQLDITVVLVHPEGTVGAAVLLALLSNGFGRALLAALAGTRAFALRYVTISLAAALGGGAVYAVLGASLR